MTWEVCDLWNPLHLRVPDPELWPYVVLKLFYFKVLHHKKADFIRENLWTEVDFLQGEFLLRILVVLNAGQ